MTTRHDARTEALDAFMIPDLANLVAGYDDDPLEKIVAALDTKKFRRECFSVCDEGSLEMVFGRFELDKSTGLYEFNSDADNGGYIVHWIDAETRAVGFAICDCRRWKSDDWAYDSPRLSYIARRMGYPDDIIVPIPDEIKTRTNGSMDVMLCFELRGAEVPASAWAPLAEQDEDEEDKDNEDAA